MSGRGQMAQIAITEGALITSPCPHCDGTGVVEVIDPEWRATRRKEIRNQILATRTRPGASNHRKQWTSAEMDVVDRDDLPLEDMAAMLGRTYKAVQMARHKVRNLPRFQRVHQGIGA